MVAKLSSHEKCADNSLLRCQKKFEASHVVGASRLFSDDMEVPCNDLKVGMRREFCSTVQFNRSTVIEIPIKI